MAFKNKLNRMKKHIVREEDKSAKPMETTADMDIPFREEWDRFDTRPFSYEDQYILLRETSYPLDYKHGAHTFTELGDVMKHWREAGLSHPLSAGDRKPEDLLFFDTETTGLGSGTGNTIFLLGAARVGENAVHVSQYFLPGPGSEVAMYHRFLKDSSLLKNLVTYNGKSFDWPMVKTRHTMIRDLVPKLPSFGHFDLLHAARRLWKEELPSVRLSVVEKEILGVDRGEDTPGYLAPMLYFDFLKDPNPTGMKGVFRHNEMDVLSLITLYIHMSKKLLMLDQETITNRERYEIARWYEALGVLDIAENIYRDSIEYAADSSSYASQKALGYLKKKQNKYREAATLWESLLQHPVSAFRDPEVLLELAKLYEHQFKEIDKAHHYAVKAFEQWKEASRILRKKADREKEAFIKRIERLENKQRSHG